MRPLPCCGQQSAPGRPGGCISGTSSGSSAGSAQSRSASARSCSSAGGETAPSAECGTDAPKCLTHRTESAGSIPLPAGCGSCVTDAGCTAVACGAGQPAGVTLRSMRSVAHASARRHTDRYRSGPTEDDAERTPDRCGSSPDERCDVRPGDGGRPGRNVQPIIPRWRGWLLAFLLALVLQVHHCRICHDHSSRCVVVGLSDVGLSDGEICHALAVHAPSVGTVFGLSGCRTTTRQLRIATSRRC